MLLKYQKLSKSIKKWLSLQIFDHFQTVLIHFDLFLMEFDFFKSKSNGLI